MDGGRSSAARRVSGFKWLPEGGPTALAYSVLQQLRLSTGHLPGEDLGRAQEHGLHGGALQQRYLVLVVQTQEACHTPPCWSVISDSISAGNRLTSAHYNVQQPCDMSYEVHYLECSL